MILLKSIRAPIRINIVDICWTIIGNVWIAMYNILISWNNSKII